MKEVRVQINATMIVYVEEDVPEDQVGQTAIDITTEQVKRLDESESGIHDPDLYLSAYDIWVTDIEEVDVE